ncbi:MAG: hypothetical protein ACLQG3_05080 [Terracidiphilus sp.]
MRFQTMYFCDDHNAFQEKSFHIVKFISRRAGIYSQYANLLRHLETAACQIPVNPCLPPGGSRRGGPACPDGLALAAGHAKKRQKGPKTARSAAKIDHFCRDFRIGMSIPKELALEIYPPGVLEKF